ncbi:MAG TPA: NTP transferase domain-containing protein [Solirubrobacteraceae bacterium]|nr:NTP transferase domain-containing protein [Solirubrobacteraceae bacterium]
MPITAVILAAGRGTRLRAGCKPLAIVGGMTLLERAVGTARAAGLRRIVVAVDSLDGPVAAFCRTHLPDVEVAWARDSERGNGATVLAGLAHAGGRCLVMMVDHLHEPESLERLLAADGDLVFAVDSHAGSIDLDDATLVRHENGAVVDIAKRLSDYDAVETGLALCSAAEVVEVAGSLQGELEFNRVKRAWLDAGRRIGTVDIDGAYWADIDTPRERRRAIGELVDRHGAKPTDGPVARVLNRPVSRFVSRRLLATRIGPNPVTIANLGLLVLAGVLLAFGADHDGLLIAGGVLVQLASALDGVDGELARVAHRRSELGAVLDAVCDRYGDLAVFIGAAIAADTTVAWLWALAAVVANWQLSFLRREHERIAGALPPSHVRWQWSRDVRLLVLAVSCVALQPLWGLVAAAVLGNLDALRRLVALIRAGRRHDRDAAPAASLAENG